MKLAVKKFGEVREGELKFALEVLDECYRRLKPHALSLVDLYVFEKSSAMTAFLAWEREQLRIKTSDVSEQFFAVHDAWRGIPRIAFSLEKMRVIPQPVVVGGLRHEAAHTVLHGSPEYYIIPIPEPLRKMEVKYGLHPQMTEELLYLISMAVKDCEVTELLYSRGYLEDQVAYNKFFLSTTGEDEQTWELARAEPSTAILFLTSLLKTACCTAPLLGNKRHGKELQHALRESLAFLPLEFSSKIPTLAARAAEGREGDTHRKILLFTQDVVSELIRPLFHTQGH